MAVAQLSSPLARDSAWPAQEDDKRVCAPASHSHGDPLGQSEPSDLQRHVSEASTEPPPTEPDRRPDAQELRNHDDDDIDDSGSDSDVDELDAESEAESDAGSEGSECEIPEQRVACMNELPSLLEVLGSSSPREVANCLKALQACHPGLLESGYGGTEVPITDLEDDSDDEDHAVERVDFMGQLPGMSEIFGSASAEEVADCLRAYGPEVISSVNGDMRSAVPPATLLPHWQTC